MGVRRLEELDCWRLAEEYKLEVYALVNRSVDAREDFHYKNQLQRSTASVGMNICEGFHRYGAKEFVRFLSIALGSLAESRQWLRDGISRRHFATSACAHAFALNTRCRMTTWKLLRSLQGFTPPGKGHSARAPRRSTNSE